MPNSPIYTWMDSKGSWWSSFAPLKSSLHQTLDNRIIKNNPTMWVIEHLDYNEVKNITDIIRAA